MRDLLRAEAEDIADTVARLVEIAPDVLILQNIDYDHEAVALGLFQQALADAGLELPHQFAAQPNAGLTTGFDLNRNGYFGDAEDSQGFGKFTGQGGIALLSRLPIRTDLARDFSSVLWRDLPDGTPPADYYTSEELDVLRLFSVAAWDVPISTSSGELRMLMFHATPPVFDGPEDRNGLRNADQLRFWQKYLDGWSPEGHSNPPENLFVLAGDFNNDLAGGEGLKPALSALLDHPRLQDPLATSAATVLWDFEGGPGALRVDYVLPSAALKVLAAGTGRMGGHGQVGSRHAPIWVDIELP